MRTKLAEYGYEVIASVFDHEEISKMRKMILANLSIMSNTRPTKTSLHLAGFHRFPRLEALHGSLSSNPKIQEALASAIGKLELVTIGLSDITINRSQEWHTDLLRGRYSAYLAHTECWSAEFLPCIKLLVYLQDGQSLRVVPGSHRTATSLTNDELAIPGPGSIVEALKVNSGDAILMDIRLVHRGATEEEMAQRELYQDAKILVSMVFGARYSPLTHAMQLGNAHRLVDWEEQHRPASGGGLDGSD